MHRPSLTGDYPRVGGEKQKFLAVLGDNQGSPPHGRGKVHRQGREGRSRRITPAWAGKSSCTAASFAVL